MRRVATFSVRDFQLPLNFAEWRWTARQEKGRGVPCSLPWSRPLDRRLLTSWAGRRARERVAGRRLGGPEGGGRRAVPVRSFKTAGTSPHAQPATVSRRLRSVSWGRAQGLR